MNNKSKNKLLTFFLITFVFSVSFTSGFNSGLESLGKTKSNWPVEKTKIITSNFEYRKDPFGSGKVFFHNGLDIGAPEGEKVIAIEDGEVIRASFYGGYGNTVCIKGAKTNYTYLYGHLDGKFLVKKGQKVNSGDVIAKVGPKNIYNVPNNPFKDINGNPTNGNTTGAHLHFSIIIDGKFVDPKPILNKLNKKE